MSDNIKAFQLDLQRLQNLVPERALLIKRYIVLDLNSEIILGNPVDTGYSRANWRIANGEPNTTVTGQRVKGQVMSANALDLGAVQEITLQEPTFITNSVNYVKFLEEGTSKMAPRHFVKRAIQIVQVRMRQYLSRAEAEAA